MGREWDAGDRIRGRGPDKGTRSNSANRIASPYLVPAQQAKECLIVLRLFEDPQAAIPAVENMVHNASRGNPC